ncbi:hypothetical protein BC829DRAFT_388629 [Chytridium lagenaria]|nr:hypothetical protein BC829DRAFT_388629 [Chytridium lagenaria]
MNFSVLSVFSGSAGFHSTPFFFIFLCFLPVIFLYYLLPPAVFIWVFFFVYF